MSPQVPTTVSEPAEPIAAGGRSRRRAVAVMMVGGYANLGLTAAQGLVLVPLYLHHLGPRLYGAWLGSGDILGWLGVLDLGVASFMIQRIGAAHGRGDRASVGDYLASGVVAQLVLVTLLVLGAIGISPWIPGRMGIEGGEAALLASAFVLAAVGTGFGILNNGIAGFAVALQSPAFSNIAGICTNLLGIAATVLLLLGGFGLWALAAGIVVRNGLLLAANSGYAWRLYRAEIRTPFWPRRRVLREVGSLSTPAFLSSIGSAAVGRSEAALIAIFLRPELATLYVLTRRAAEIAAMFLARIGGAVFPGFAHLIGSEARVRAERVRQEVMRAYLALGTLMIALYLALNRSFMALWVGPDQFGGFGLTLLIGGSTLVAGYGALASYLFGATGRIARASLLIFAEAMARLAAMAALLFWLGLPGLPLATLLTSGWLGALASRWTRREIGPDDTARGPKSRVWGHLALLALGAAAGLVQWGSDWPRFFLSATLLFGTAAALLVAFDGYVRGLVKGRALPALRSRLGLVS